MGHVVLLFRDLKKHIPPDVFYPTPCSTAELQIADETNLTTACLLSSFHTPSPPWTDPTGDVENVRGPLPSLSRAAGENFEGMTSRLNSVTPLICGHPGNGIAS